MSNVSNEINDSNQGGGFPVLSSSSFEPLPDPDESDDYNDVIQLNDDDFLLDGAASSAHHEEIDIRGTTDNNEGNNNNVNDVPLEESYGISYEDDYDDVAMQGFDYANSSACASIQDSNHDCNEEEEWDHSNALSQSDNDSNNFTMDGRMSPKKKPAQLKDDYANDDNNGEEDEFLQDHHNNEMTISDYILGTLIVRVVAARDLKAVNTNTTGGAIVGSLRDAILQNQENHAGGGKKGHSGRSSNSSVASGGNLSSSYHGTTRDDKQNAARQRRVRNKMRHHHLLPNGSSNPFATITFANQIESTSTVYDTINPSFPRHEQAYFDVSLPVSHLAHEQQVDVEERNSKLSQTSARLSKEQKHRQQEIHLPPKRPVVNITLTHSCNEENDDNYDIGYDFSKPPVKNAPRPTCIKRNINGVYSTKTLDGNDDGVMNDELNFLGTASIDVSQLITGKVTYIDEWLPLHPLPKKYNHKIPKKTKGKKKEGKNDITGQVRIICEYDMTDLSPRPGDHVRFNGFVQPMDVYPIPITQMFRVDNVKDDNDTLLLSYRSNPEDWYCTFAAHRFMFISVERHITAIERYQDELIDIVSKIVSSPAVHVVQKSVSRLPEEGIVYMGLEASLAGLGLAGRWFRGGLGKVKDDIVYATNIDGKSTTLPFDEELSTGSEHDGGRADTTANDETEDDYDYDDDLSLELNDEEMTSDNTVSDESGSTAATSAVVASHQMPCCPISGQPMKEPVVAADGHTYEKKAIARWLCSSNISPLTGKDLPHKELIPNYLLISTFGNSNK